MDVAESTTSPAPDADDVEPEPTDPQQFAGLYVELVSIRNYRGIDSCQIEFEPTLTLLVGRNNAGKSRVLRAVGIALGGLAPELDDLTVGSTESATIDVVLAPPPPADAASDEIFADEVGQRLGTVPTISEEPLRERFAWRTTIGRSAEGLGARSEMQLLTFDDAQQDWVLQNNAATLTRRQRTLFQADLVETKRDLVEELARRGSAVRRVLSDLEVDEQVRADLEKRLNDLGKEIVGSSSALKAVKTALEKLETMVGIGAPTLSPIPVRLEELSRSVSIDLDTGQGGGALPVRLHGAGARSLASLQVQGVLYDRRLGQDGPDIRPHPVTLIEEPEAHLHPQATLELAGLLTSLTGQVIASTHSSHLVTAVDPRAIRLIRHKHGQAGVVDLGPARTDNEQTHRALRPSTHAAEMEKLKRLVERPFGELLFASAIVIGDGATERAFLPVVIRHALGIKAHGVCVIDPESMSGPVARAAIKFAKLIGVPWFLFSDSDGAGKKDAQALLNDHGTEGAPEVVWIAAETDGGNAHGATERMMIFFDEDLCRKACIDVRPDLDDSADTLDLMKSVKGSIGSALARRLIEGHADHTTWPPSICDLIAKLDKSL
jgi:putative ATP-dependent endonuclease of OLD family